MAGAPARRVALAVLAVVLTGLHLWLADAVLESTAIRSPSSNVPSRLDVAFVRELQPREPPTRVLVPPAPPPRRAARAPLAPLSPASAAEGSAAQAAAGEPEETWDQTLAPVPDLLERSLDEPAELAGLAAPSDAASAPPGAADAASSAGPALASAPPAASASAPDAVPFEWPASTQLSYTLTGYYRGTVEGRAQVEWLRQGERYQVRLEVAVGPPFAPVMSRRMVSDGLLGADGLRPRRYDEETRVLFRNPRIASLRFDDEAVTLADGRRVPAPSGVQDTASQFVQLTWRFTLQPELLQAGRSVDVPLALPRRVDLWTYDVLGREPLDTPAGTVEAVHVKPRREARPGGDLTAEMWVAPSLQYLPVRIVIRQDAETFVDLLIDRLPVQAADGGASAPGR